MPEYGEPCDISPTRGPHLRTIARGAFGDVVEDLCGRSARTDKRDPEETRRLFHQVKKKGDYDKRRDAAAQSKGFPTAFWRPTRISLEEATYAPLSRRARAAAKPSGPGKSGPQRALSEPELRNARDALRGQASLHTAAVGDRFRFAADMSAGAPVVIKGAGVGSGESSSCWASDASALINFHHGHIRSIAQSGLEPLKEPPSKKKKKKSAEDDDHLQLSESGLFQPKYPIDSSLMSLRRLKKNMFPEVWRWEQEEAARQAAARALAEDDALRDKTAGLHSAFRQSKAPEI